MEAKLQRRVQRYGWDKASWHYERFWSRQLAPAQERMLRAAQLRPGLGVLDVACGTGLASIPAARCVAPEGCLIGTDISERMIEAATEAAAAAGVENARFFRMDAEQLTFEDQSFDAALCGLGLMYFPDPAQSLREMHRVLKPGGSASAAVWGERKRCGWAEIFPIVDSRVESDVCPMFFRLGTADTLTRAFEDAGFSVDSVERIHTLLDYGSAEDACGAAFAGGPVALAYSRFDDETRRAAHAEYIASIAPFRNGSGYHIPGEFVVVSGTKAATSLG